MGTLKGRVAHSDDHVSSLVSYKVLTEVDKGYVPAASTQSAQRQTSQVVLDLVVLFGACFACLSSLCLFSSHSHSCGWDT